MRLKRRLWQFAGKGTPFLMALCVAALVSSAAFSQERSLENPWREVTDIGASVASEEAPVLSLYELNAEQFDALIRRAPREFTAQALEEPLHLYLPMPDGSFVLFRVEDSPIMEPELARRFPDIRTYTLRGVDDPSLSGRLDRNHRDLHALVLTPAGAVQINPDRLRGHPFYRSIKEKPDPTDLICKAETEFAEPDGAQQLGELLQAPLHLGAPFFALLNPSGDTLRTYRFAVATTGEYYAGRDMGGGDADVLASVVSVVNKVNAVYEVEVAIRFILVGNTDDLFFTDPITDGYTNGVPCTMRNENTPIINGVIGAAAWDVGHVFGSAGGGGCAGFSVVCDDNNKGNGASGLRTDLPPDQEGFSGYRLVAHEVGHQFSAGHTWSGSNGSCTAGQFSADDAYEPLSGTTLMAYSGICGADNIQSGPDDPYFHTRSYHEIVNFSTIGGGNACAAQLVTGNSVPVVDAGPDFTIPQGTPFTLIGSATDTNDPVLSYAWEQFDATPVRVSPLADLGNNPLFRSFPPVVSDPSRTFPQLSDILNNTTTLGEILPTTNRLLNFRLTARDNRAGGGGVDHDSMQVNVVGDPFFIVSPDGGETLHAGCTEDVLWVVGGGAVAANVNLDLSEDGGLNFSPLVSNTPNDGEHDVLLPCSGTSNGRVRAEAVDNIFFDISNGDFTIVEEAPEIAAASVGGQVDDMCEFEVTFSATVTDDCSVNAADVDVVVSELTGNATLGVPSFNIAQNDSTTVDVEGSVLVSDLVASPAIVRVEVSAMDGCGFPVTETTDADVIDTTPPTIDVSLDPNLLWPPNHKLVDIMATVTVEDNCPVTSFELVSVASDEPDDVKGGGDGNTVNDIQGAVPGTSDVQFQLRAERQGKGDGRTYTVTYQVTDGSGNQATDAATVVVPH